MKTGPAEAAGKSIGHGEPGPRGRLREEGGSGEQGGCGEQGEPGEQGVVMV